MGSSLQRAHFYSVAGVIVDVTATPANPADPRSDLVFAPGAPLVVGTRRRVVEAATVEGPRGEWNTLDLHCGGQRSVHVVNGTMQVVLSGLRHVVGGGDVPLTRGRAAVPVGGGGGVRPRDHDPSDPRDSKAAGPPVSRAAARHVIRA